MGKKSRKKKQTRGGGAVDSNQPPAVLPDRAFVAPPDYSASGTDFVLERFRQVTDEFYGLSKVEAGRLLNEGLAVAKLITVSNDIAESRQSLQEVPRTSRALTPALEQVYEMEFQTILEFMHLAVFPQIKEMGFEAALDRVRRWPKFRRYWRRTRRRICDYCGRRDALSKPRLLVCAGCGVARYCEEECQALDFSHHAQCCPLLARRWDGVGESIPLQLFDLCASGKWDDPAVLPNVRARERLREMIGGVEKFIDRYKAAEKVGR